MATGKHVNIKEYETIYILRSDVDAETADKVQTRTAEVIGREAGTVVKIENWGRRKLAYPVAKMKRGVYFYVKYVGRGGLVAELERTLKLADSVIKFQTVLLRELVDMTALAIDPEEAKVQKVELSHDDDEKESREKALGLVDLGPDAPRSRHAEEEFVEEEFDADAVKTDVDAN